MVLGVPVANGASKITRESVLSLYRKCLRTAMRCCPTNEKRMEMTFYARLKFRQNSSLVDKNRIRLAYTDGLEQVQSTIAYHIAYSTSRNQLEELPRSEFGRIIPNEEGLKPSLKSETAVANNTDSIETHQKIKLVMGQHKRRISSHSPVGLFQLRKLIQNTFCDELKLLPPSPSTDCPAANYTIEYTDDDGDMIQITNDEELVEAIQIMESMGTSVAKFEVQLQTPVDDSDDYNKPNK